MAIDPVTGALILGGADFLGSVFGGESEESKLSKEQLRESRLQNRGQTAVGLQRQMDMNPMRDRLVFNLMQRLGMSPGQFRPNDVFNGMSPEKIGMGPVALGGLDQDQLAIAKGGYRPGMGGQSTGVAQDFMSRLGYGANPLREPEKLGLFGALRRSGQTGQNYNDILRNSRRERDEFERRMGGY